MSSGDTSEPVTSTSMFSCGVLMTPEGTTAFCSAIAASTCSRLSVEVGELLRREAQVHLLVLVAEDLDLADVRRAQELGARRLGEVARLARREAVVGDAVDDAEDVAELVVEEGPDHALRQRHLDVADLLADLVPDVLDLVARRRLLAG